MSSFELVEPSSLEEAFAAIDRDEPAIRPIGGGTALMLMIKAQLFRPLRLVSLRRVDARFSGISLRQDRAFFRIGAMTTFSAIEHSLELRAHFPVLARTMRSLANVRVRNVATVGGNLAHADPHLDLPPVWIALGAEVLVLSPGRERIIPVEDIFAGYYETTLRHNDLIAELRVPLRPSWRAVYFKVTTRAAHDWPALGIAIAADISNDIVRDLRIVLSAAIDKPTRLIEAESVLRGAAVEETNLRRAADAATQEVEIEADSRGSASYKKHLLRRLSHPCDAGRRAGICHVTDRGATTQIGRSIPRLEAREKVTGRTEYVHNLQLPGMLHGKIFRSTMPHARIKAIDVSAALALAGVHRVVTIEDIRKVIPDPYYGPAFHDQPILADGKVRFAGEPVAVVLATDRKIAEEAAGLITAEYEELPAVYDEMEAASSSIFLHSELKPAATFPDLQHLKGRRDTNVALDYHLLRGDPEAAFAAADHLFEHIFRTQPVMHTPMEPFVSIADATDERVTVHTASQGPSFVRIEIARLLGWPENRVRVKVPHLGGGFGAKLYIKLEALVTALSMIVRRPVKISLTMEEQFFMVTRHPCTFKIKSGVDKDGRITARRCEIWWNGGAYADIGPRVTQKAGFTAAGPYDIENVAVDSYAVYTNRPPAGALRGFGAPQTCWAYECHMDMIAEALGFDKVEFRRRNLLQEGRPQASGTIMRDAALEQVLDRLSDRMNWKLPIERGSGSVRRGRGIAIGFKGITAPTTSVAIVNLYGDGSCGLYIGTVDMGQGSDTVMAQIAAEVLNIDARSIRVIHPDTDVTPYDMGTLGSRSTFHMGNAVRLAAEDANRKIEELAAVLGLPPGRNVPLAELFRRKYGMQAGNIIGTGSFIPAYEKPDSKTGASSNITPFWGVGASGAEVEVDIETGQFRVMKLVNIADIGMPINPSLARAQLSGAAIMQLGFTTTENMIFRDGQLTNNSLSDYKIPTLLDLPPLFINEFVEARQNDGPFGAKGAGESTTIALSPAIGNAIADAVGVRPTDLPITPEFLCRALQAAKGMPLAGD